MARPAARMTHQCGPVSAAWRLAAMRTRVITPMVFWPSDVPWARATREAVKAWPYLKPVFMCSEGQQLVIRYAGRVAMAAAVPATSGATIAGSRTLDTMTEPLTVLIPAPTITAPMRPPKRAWEELEGRPSSQVSRFQTIAPTRPASTIGAVTRASSKKPPEMVLATSVDRQAPNRLRMAARMTAVRGLSAPVAIGPAMAFALSWNPLVKSKIRATMITTMTTNNSVTRVPSNELRHR